MNFSRLFTLLITVACLSSCTHRIVRQDYSIKRTDYRDCDLLISENLDLAQKGTRIGSIDMNNTKFSFDCDRNEAMNILEREGCALRADFILILSEKEPDMESGCYKCEASFYALNPASDSTQLTREELLLMPDTREKNGKEFPFAPIHIASFAAVFAIGFLIVTILY